VRRPVFALLPYAVALAVLLALPRVVYPVLALDMLLWGLLAVSVDLLLGFAGLLSFGHAAFWGFGGYTAAILAKSLDLPFAVAALAGALAAALLAVPLGYLAIRRRGIYFAMVTLAFAQMLFYVANEWRPLTGGENGVQGVPRLFPGLSLGRSMDFYYAALPLIVLGFALAYRIVHSPFGHVLVAIRDNEARAQALGYATWRYKLLAFALSGALAGLAGALFSLGHGFASLEQLHWSTSGIAVLMTILGGIGTLWGGVIGAAIVLEVRDLLSNAPEASGVVTGAVFVVIVLAFRHGLWASATDALRWIRARRSVVRGPDTPDPREMVGP
jgi:branched-chain amino acid transport system permease protein